MNPKYAHNVGMVVRLACAYGFKQVWWTGNRVSIDLDTQNKNKKGKKKRLPREERMKGYQDVDMIQCDEVFDHFPNATPVAIEVREGSENLLMFEHPRNPLYVFGPEDGSVPKVMLQHCHRFVTIPTHHCLNLATAVSTVLYDRTVKNYLNGDEMFLQIHPGWSEERGFVNCFKET